MVSLQTGFTVPYGYPFKSGGAIPSYPAYGCRQFPLPDIQLMQELVDKRPVRVFGKRLFNQSAKPAEVAFNPSQFQPGLLMLQTWNRRPQAYPFAERRK